MQTAAQFFRFRIIENQQKIVKISIQQMISKWLEKESENNKKVDPQTLQSEVQNWEKIKTKIRRKKKRTGRPSMDSGSLAPPVKEETFDPLEWFLEGFGKDFELQRELQEPPRYLAMPRGASQSTRPLGERVLDLLSPCRPSCRCSLNGVCGDHQAHEGRHVLVGKRSQDASKTIPRGL